MPIIIEYQYFRLRLGFLYSQLYKFGFKIVMAISIEELVLTMLTKFYNIWTMQ